MAQLSQERHTELVDGTQELFVITSTMISATIPAQLPHLFVFVMKIVTRDDPKDDVLSRVARISDLTLLPQGRVAALASALGSNIEYLSTSVRLAYPTLTEALDAKTAIKDRVNQLITDWAEFQSEFNAPDPSPEIFTLPSVDPSQKAALIAAYKAAKEDRYNKQLAKAAADATLSLANTSYTNANAAVAAVQGFSSSAASVSAEMTTVSAAYSSLTSSGNTFLGLAGCAAAPDKATFQSALSTAAAQIIANGAYQSDAAALASGLSLYISGTLVPARTAAQASLTAAQADQITKTQSLASAVVTENAALAAVVAICPDFDESSICLVPSP